MKTTILLSVAIMSFAAVIIFAPEEVGKGMVIVGIVLAFIVPGYFYMMKD